MMKLTALFFLLYTSVIFADITREQAITIGEKYISHQWTAENRHVRHGMDSSGIEIHTPDQLGGYASPESDAWTVGDKNTGVPYKWGGWDTPEKFDAGLKKGLAAGDVYSSEKRSKSGAAVSGDSVGVDCSGFVSRCWGLKKRESTSSLGSISRRLPSTANLKPADVMNMAGGHVILFVRWLDAEKIRALFYEAAPFSKTRAVEHSVEDLTNYGFVPLRYRDMRDERR